MIDLAGKAETRRIVVPTMANKAREPGVILVAMSKPRIINLGFGISGDRFQSVEFVRRRNDRRQGVAEIRKAPEQDHHKGDEKTGNGFGSPLGVFSFRHRKRYLPAASARAAACDGGIGF
jgi:hypothetical protein